ncbi:MAG: AI-2E family transporter, partial [Bacteroidota bacterium]|nr:AI-2E family transporter [Bacteroidota bacterium]MDX5431054.1 AI-2E family transporter [Bacteroidota bacterium]MDX5469808.1 AI-2E family transporter [Bacteroidota bacterium]
MNTSNRLANTAYLLIILVIGGYLLSIGKALIVPMILAVILSFLLYPACRWLEKKKFPRILSIMTVMLGSMALLLGVLVLFTKLFAGLFSNLEDFKLRLLETVQ